MQLTALRLAALPVAVLLAPLSLLPDEQAVFKVDVGVVNVLAVVRDRHGQLVDNLGKDDFLLKEDGKKQEIRYFSRSTDLPLTLGLLVDTSQSQANLIEAEHRAAQQLFEQVLRPSQDQAFVIKFDREVELLQDLSGSRQVLEKALDELGERPSLRRESNDGRQNWMPQWGGGIPFPGGGGQRRPGGMGGGRGGPVPGQPGGGRGGRGGGAGVGTALYDAVYLACNEVLTKPAGRKSIILISDGVDAGSKVTAQMAIEAAQRADVVVYSVRYFDESAYRGGGWMAGSRGEGILKRISTETGGREFEISKKLTLEQAFDQIQNELRNQYSIGYRPDDSASYGYRRIALSTKKGGLKVQAREGYYARPDARSDASNAPSAAPQRLR